MMTDEEIAQIAYDVDSFIIKELQDFKISSIDLSAIVNSRLRALSVSEGLESDFDALLDHLNSQTVTAPKQLH